MCNLSIIDFNFQVLLANRIWKNRMKQKDMLPFSIFTKYDERVNIHGTSKKGTYFVYGKHSVH